MLLNRVDNFFYNTTDVRTLAEFYADTMGVPIRREQILKPGLMWMETNVGGMELSFRKADGTPQEHPDLEGNFLEVPPGRGATISFEVSDTERVRADLEERGVKFHGPSIHCTGGREIISIFEDPFGRPVQLYEARFANAEEAERVGKRASRNLTDPNAPGETGTIGANIRDVRDMALSAAFYVDDIPQARHFYADVLGLPLVKEEEQRLVFELDGATLEFRRFDDESSSLSPSDGGIVAFEVRNLDVAHNRLQLNNSKLRMSDTMPQFAGDKVGSRRGGLQDIDGNPVELWER